VYDLVFLGGLLLKGEKDALLSMRIKGREREGGKKKKGVDLHECSRAKNWEKKRKESATPFCFSPITERNRGEDKKKK